MTVSALPGLLRVIVAVPLLPTFTLLKFTLVGLIVNLGCGCAVATPPSASVIGEFGALLAMVMLPLALPTVVGANFAVKEVPCPAFNVTGVAKPLMLKPVPEALADETTTLAVPMFVKVTATDALAPLTRLPKLILAGLALSCPRVPKAVRGMVIDGSDASLVITIVPEKIPVFVGANCAVKVAFCPAAIVLGVANPVIAKPNPPALAEDIVTLEFPVFESVMG